jgi:D-glucosaminate-6-phosphate ammonia-lyase
MKPRPIKRRTALCTLAGLPGMGLLLDSGQAHAVEPGKSRDVIEELGVRSFINAAGTFTALTGSLMRPEAVAAMQIASKKFVRLEDLRDAVGKRIAEPACG